MKTDSDTGKWLDRLVPLPKEINVEGSVVVRAGQVGLNSCDRSSPVLRTATELIRAFAKGKSEDVSFTISLALCDDEALNIGEEVKNRLVALPNWEQAYAILWMNGKSTQPGLLLVANTDQGLLFAARTLALLVDLPGDVGSDTQLEIPLLNVTDWPDLAERGQWGGNSVSDLPWTSQWKLNVLEAGARATLDDVGEPTADIRRDLLDQGARLGVKVVPFISHIEQISQAAGLMDHEDIISTPDPSQPLPSDYVPGLCMSSEATQELIEGWLEDLAATEGVTDIQVWLSEGAAPCYCEKCRGKEPFAMEVSCISRAFERVRLRHPQVRLRILLSQGSFPVNDKILAMVPEQVGITYYDGGRTYDSSAKPMIYPLLEDYARSGRWLGVYPQITHCWRTVFPWTAPQFIQYRAQEFVDKQLNCVIGYAVPSNRYHEFNVMALAEWSWNCRGRSPEDFSRACATIAGFRGPELFARWAVKAGEAGWPLAASRLLGSLIYDPTMGLEGGVPFDHRFEMATILDVAKLDEALATAHEALDLAREAQDANMIDESECVIAGLEAFGTLQSISRALGASSLGPEDREVLGELLEKLDKCAHVLRTRVLDWGQRVCARTGDKLPGRLLDTAFVLLRTCDAIAEQAAMLGVTDWQPDSRLKKLGEWAARDFRDSPHTTLTFDLSNLVPHQGGSYQVGFEFIESAYGADVEKVAVVEDDTAGSGARVVAETPDLLQRVSRWERWHEVRVEIPDRSPDTSLVLEIGLCGLPDDAPTDRRTCAGSIGIRRVWPKDRAPWEMSH